VVVVRVPSVVVVVLVVMVAAAAAGAGAQVRGAVRPLPRPDGPVARPLSARAARPGPARPGPSRPGPAAWPGTARPGGLRGAVVPARPGVCEGRGRVGGLPYISYPSLG
jgi:hypothetical protein